MGLPNCSRVVAYSIALSRQVRAAPVTPQAMPNLASVRHDSGPLSPETPGSTASAGRRTSSRCSSDVMDARSDIFLWMSRAVRPTVPRGTRNPRMPSEVFAQTTAISAMLPLVIHILVPESTQSVFCSSDPYRQIGYMDKEPWTDAALRRPESHASSSRHATP